MPSYDLNQLGSDKFEQLVQSLLKGIIGPGTITFGAGKDGAREAVYQGKAPYPSVNENWEGNWIFQVKFHETQLGIEKARTSTRREIRSELEKIVRKYAHPCDNYIFVTNVPLSGVYQSGDHDFIQSDIKPQFPSIKNIHIWGADEIYRFLDQYQSIRSAFDLISLEDWCQRKRDLLPSEFKLELPICREPEIDRDSLTAHIAKSLGKDTQSRILAGQAGTGKTILAAQFKKHFPDTTIVYFIDHTPASQNIHTFLYSICCQAAAFLGEPRPNIELTAEVLGTIVNQHVSSLNKLAITQRKNYYVIIDGIEHSFQGVNGSRIIDKLPFRTYPDSPYILLTIEKSRFSEIPQSLESFPQIELPLEFDKDQTRKFLGDLFTSSESDAVHVKYRGVPGYLSIIKNARLLDSNFDPQSSPTDLTQLLEQQVNNVFSSMTSGNKQVVEMLASCNSSLSEEILLKYGDSQEVGDIETLKNCILIRYTNGRYEIENKEIQNIIRSRLPSPVREHQIELLRYIKDQHPTEDLAIDALMNELQDQQGIEDRLKVNPIVSTLTNSSTGLLTVLNRFNSAISIAYQSNDIESLLRHGIGITLTRRFPEHLVNQGQIDALIALDEWQPAVNRAYLISDPIAQITTLSQIFASLHLRGIKASDEALGNLRHEIERLNPDEIDKEIMKQIAIEILPIFPDLAIELLEAEIGAVEGQSIIEFTLDTMFQSIDNSETLDFRSEKDPRVFSLFLEKYNYEEFLKQLPKFTNTRAKEYVVRKWCSSNPTSKHLVDGLDMWQRIVIDDRNFVVPLRCLREVSGLLNYVPVEARLVLIKKIEVPHVFSLEAPIEDWIQVQVNLAEAVYELDDKSCIDYLEFAYKKFQEKELDLDQAAYFLARLLLALKKYQHALADEVETKLQEVFYKLRDNSAEQFDAIKRVLPIWVEIDRDTAFIIATELNTFGRRMKAIRLVLLHALEKFGNENLDRLIADSRDEIGETDFPRIIAGILFELAGDKVELCIDTLNGFVSYVEKFDSPELKAKSFRSLGVLYSVISSNEADCWFEKSIQAWRLMEDMKKQFAIGYEIVEGYAEVDLNKAKIFYREVENLKTSSGSNLAIGPLGIDYRSIVSLSIRALNNDNLVRYPDIVSDIVTKINVIPSEAVKAELFTILATTLYRLEYIEKADEIVQRLVLPLIKERKGIHEQINILRNSLAAIFRYDLQEALRIVQGFDSFYKDIACMNAIQWRLTNAYLPDNEHIPIENIQIPHKRQTLSDCCDLAGAIDEDYILNIVVKLISQCIVPSLQKEKLDQSQAYDLTVRLENVVNKKLPQNTRNIKHDGYKILALAYVNQCRSMLYKHLQNTKGLSTRNFRREPIKKQWQNLTQQARQIPNVSDRVLVLSELATLSLSYYTKEGKHICKNLLQEAESFINDIPTLIDRADRYESVGRCWHKLGDRQQADFIFRQVGQLAHQLYGVDAEERIRSLVQSASMIDEGLAEKILSDLDTTRLPSSVVRSAEIQYQITKVIAKPSQQTTKGNKRQRESALAETYISWLSSLITERRVPEKLDKLVKQVKESLDYSPTLVYQVVEWCIENIQRGYLRHGVDVLEYIRLADLVDGISRFATDNSDNLARMIQDTTPVISNKIYAFGVGESEKASRFISDWITENAKDSIIFCDPYFGLSELSYIRYVPVECPVTIITTERGIDVSTGKSDVIRSWRKITDQELPDITIYVYKQLLEDKFHDRAILSASSAISIGQSLNGLGKSRGVINLLSDDEARELEDKYITPLLQVSRQRKDHRPTTIEVSQ